VITTMENAAPYILAVVLTCAGVALCAAHIPGLRTLTGAAPLQREDEDQQGHHDFAAPVLFLALAAADTPADTVAAAAATVDKADGGVGDDR
jgi:hypothetical protein